MPIYILDTSVIISNPRIYDEYENVEFIIPIIVLEELDKIKHQSGDAARNARIAIKYIDELTKNLDIENGIKLENGSVIHIDGKAHKLPIGQNYSPDLEILACANYFKKKNKDQEVIVLSNDVNMKVRARALNMKAEGYDGLKSDLSELYTGIQYVHNNEALAELYEKKYIKDLGKYEIEMTDNEYLAFENDDCETTLGKFQDGHLKLIDLNKKVCEWVEPQNIEQACALDAMMNKDIPLVSLIGTAGSGKTVLTLGAAMDLVLEKRLYDKIVIYKSIVPVGADIGFAPGTVQEKLAHWFGSIYDGFEFLLTQSKSKEERKHYDFKKDLEMFEKKGQIKFEAMTFIRGRSIDNAIVVMDEAQNLTKGEIKALITRLGKNSKIFLTADIEQIDNFKLDALNNGLTYLVEKFKGNPISTHITLKECERSTLSEVASKIL